jgi:hypothetical protein
MLARNHTRFPLYSPPIPFCLGNFPRPHLLPRNPERLRLPILIPSPQHKCNQQDSSKAPAKPERESETVSQLVDLLRRCGNAVAVKYLQSCFSVGKCSLVTVEFIGVIKCCLRGRAFEGHEAVDTHAGVETFEARE